LYLCEPFLVKRLRNSDAFIPELSLVAEVESKIVGHILLTRLLIHSQEDMVESLSLAPVSVRPEFQGKGVGSKLINHAHEIAIDLGFGSVILVGHENYYPRFGYRPINEYGISLPFDAPPENCMILELQDGALNGISGKAEFAPEFFG
jgi:predicted N-acetyltransferase YhbS